MQKEYLGDSVYVEIEGDRLKLTTNNGLPADPSNTIFLDVHVYDALVGYFERACKEARAADAEPTPPFG